ncbi:hypothetical protein AB0D49_14870 [Streptomyces sp. NPDC048290]|uniref:hypothetical protein n=1 Tax=Streptomyces sp. NPDC048290 TaxID=3155811 RepID=UPI00342E328A
MSEYVIKSGDREAVIAGLRELAQFLADNPEVLVPPWPSFVLVVSAVDNAARREGADFAARPLDVQVEDLGEGFYSAARAFGPVSYRVAAVPPREDRT